MNELEEIKKIIKNFVCESTQLKMQISKIENKRIELAQERNEKKKINTSNSSIEINVLGEEISKLGNESQELQNKLSFKFNKIKNLVNLTIDNIITDEIRRLHKIDEEKNQLKEKIQDQKEKDSRYEFQKKEFYERFGRMPEISESSRNKEIIRNKKISSYNTRINEIEKNIIETEGNLAELATIKRNFKNENWDNIFENKKIENEVEEESVVLPLMEEEFQIEKIEPIEYVSVEKLEPIEKIEIGEVEIEEPEYVESEETSSLTSEMEPIYEDEIEKLARAIVEEIVEEQTKDSNISSNLNEINSSRDNQVIENVQTDIKNVDILDVIAKIEDGEIVYKANISNGEEIKVYPTLEATNIILNDMEYREAINGFLMDYAIDEHKIFDNSVIKKIDPTICEIIERFSQKYDLDEGDLMYNYAMSFSQKNYIEIENTIPITYNLSYLKYTNLSKRERIIIKKICKNSLNNKSVDIIGAITGFGKIRYMLKRLFNINSVKALTDGKYE